MLSLATSESTKITIKGCKKFKGKNEVIHRICYEHSENPDCRASKTILDKKDLNAKLFPIPYFPVSWLKLWEITVWILPFKLWYLFQMCKNTEFKNMWK